MSRITEWWITRSRAAIVVNGSLKMRCQSEKTRLVVIPTDLRSYRSARKVNRTPSPRDFAAHSQCRRGRCRQSDPISLVPGGGADRAWQRANVAPGSRWPSTRGDGLHRLVHRQRRPGHAFCRPRLPASNNVGRILDGTPRFLRSLRLSIRITSRNSFSGSKVTPHGGTFRSRRCSGRFQDTSWSY